MEMDVVVQLLSCVRLFVTLWTAACQASLSFTVSLSFLKLMSIESVMPSNHLILYLPLLLLPSTCPTSWSFSVRSRMLYLRPGTAKKNPRRTSCEDEGRDGGDAATRQRPPRTASQHPGAWRGLQQAPTRASEGAALPTLDLGFPVCRTGTVSFCSKPPALILGYAAPSKLIQMLLKRQR